MANIISIFRMILAIITISLLFLPNAGTKVYLICFALTIIVIWMDGLDGYIARKLNETSKFGAVLDIIGDRVVENIYWISFLALGWVPLWIPIIAVTRGLITDGLRSVAMEQGYTPFGKTTMMESQLGKFIVTSNFSRGTYAAMKAVAFCLLIVAHVPQSYPYQNIVTNLAYISAYIAVFLCVARGLPVLIESRRFFPSKNA